jgi:HK97 family phage major capsid protein
MAAELLGLAFETGMLASRIARIQASSGANSLKINGIDETSRANGSRYGGIRAYWEGEADQFTATRPKFRQIELRLKKLTGICYATDELLEDSGALESIVREGFASEFGFVIDDAIVNGDGVGKPLGYMNAAALVSVAKETGQTAATVVAGNVLKMFGRMPPSLRRDGVWLVNMDVEQQLPQMTIGDMPVYLPPGGITNAPFGTLLGRPVLPIEQCQTLGTKGDIAFFAPSQYQWYDKGGVQQASSIHVRFDYNETAFRFTYRADGQPRWHSALTPFKGTATLSPFIVLDTRA